MLIALHGGGIDQFEKRDESVICDIIVCVYPVEMFLA